MSTIKLVLTDIDGTLVDHAQNEVSEKVHQAVLKLEAQGVIVTAVTGRPYGMAEPLLKKLGFKDLCVFDGGASIRSAETGELVWSKWLDVPTIRAITKIMLPHADIIDFFTDYKEISPENVTLDDIVEPAPYVFAFVDITQHETILKQLRSIPDIVANVGAMRRGAEGLADIQVVHKEADKFHGINALRGIVHSDIEHTLAIGDGANDIPLFQNAGTKVAMGNAIEELKELADYVVASVEQDGFAEAMERFVLD